MIEKLLNPIDAKQPAGRSEDENGLLEELEDLMLKYGWDAHRSFSFLSNKKNVVPIDDKFVSLLNKLDSNQNKNKLTQIYDNNNIS